MVSTKTAALATAVIAFLGWGIQLGSLAAWNSYACRSSSSIVTLDAAALTSLLSGRKLLAAPSESELNARCSFSLGMDWWTVFYQFGIVAAALYTARDEGLLTRSRTRIGILFAIAIVWVVIRVNAVVVGQAGVVGSPITVQNALRDAGVTEKEFKDATASAPYIYGIYTSTRAYAAGAVISAISYFMYIVFVLAEDEQFSAKAAETEEAA